MRPSLEGRGPHRVSGGEGILFCNLPYLRRNPSTVPTATVPLPLGKGGNFLFFVNFGFKNADVRKVTVLLVKV